MTKELRVLELFAGIGACSKALTNLKIPHRIVDAVEIDKYAIKSFNAIHGTDFVPQDISKWDKNIEVDLIMHGSPCQDFSIAGKQRGGDKGSGTRSSLMYETLRIIEKLRPKYVIWENVKNLKSAKHIHNWHAYCTRMNELGYSNNGEVLNAKDYGIPQNRERLFTVSYLCDTPRSQFVFPPKVVLETIMADYLETDVDPKYVIGKDIDWVKYKEIANTIRVGNRESLDRQTWDAIRVVGELKIKGNEQVRRVYDKNACAPTLNTCGGGNRQPKIIQQITIPQTVRVRKYNVDTDGLKKVLRTHKNMTNREISEKLELPITTVEHWFRNDGSFSIPEPDVWFKLKELFGITTDEFDKSITDFIERDGVYEKSNRFYIDRGIAPTLTRTNADEKIIETNGEHISVVRRLTPLECWRLMGFDDSDFEKCRAVNSDTQLYKQAGNSIVVDVLMAILKNLLGGNYGRF